MDSLTGIGLCAGVGWLDLAVKFAWDFHGVDYRTVAFVERDAYAASVLVARMEDASLEPAVISDNIEDIDESFRGVDCFVAGFPCQDISVAGKREGVRGKRSGLWFTIADRIGVVRPRFVFLENVAAITSGGSLDAVLGSLSELGYDAEWGCLKASSVDAPHQRDRWFCVAHATQRGLGELRQSSECNGQPDGCGEDVGDAECGGYESWGYDRQKSEKPTTGCCDVGNTNFTRLEKRRSEPGDFGQKRTTAERASLFPPGPNQHAEWQRVVTETPWLSPATERGFRMLADGGSLVVDQNRADQLRCAGNGVVVLQGAVAFAELIARIKHETSTPQRNGFACESNA